MPLKQILQIHFFKSSRNMMLCPLEKAHRASEDLCLPTSPQVTQTGHAIHKETCPAVRLVPKNQPMMHGSVKS